MDLQMVGTGIAVASCIAGVALYVIRTELKGDVTRLDGRINVQQALHAKLGEDVSYIRERIDTALNGHR